MARTMPKQKPGKSETVVRTPPEFVQAVKNFLGIKEFGCDLAASKNNHVAPLFITKDVDSLSCDWGLYKGWCWLNPPYDDIASWTKKCWESKDTNVVLLVPASGGANWWRDWVHDKARVYFVNPRLTFLDKDGKRHPHCYPKDLALILYGDEPGYSIFEWRREL